MERDGPSLQDRESIMYTKPWRDNFSNDKPTTIESVDDLKRISMGSASAIAPQRQDRDPPLETIEIAIDTIDIRGGNTPTIASPIELKTIEFVDDLKRISMGSARAIAPQRRAPTSKSEGVFAQASPTQVGRGVNAKVPPSNQRALRASDAHPIDKGGDKGQFFSNYALEGSDPKFSQIA